MFSTDECDSPLATKKVNHKGLPLCTALEFTRFDWRADVTRQVCSPKLLFPPKNYGFNRESTGQRRKDLSMADGHLNLLWGWMLRMDKC